MRFKFLKDRRVIFGIGAALLVGGWGMTRMAHERMAHFSLSERYLAPMAWNRGSEFYLVNNTSDITPTVFLLSPRAVYIIGVVRMAAGAGLIGFGAKEKAVR